MTREVGLKVGSSIGRVEDVRVPRDGGSWSRGLRVRVQVDITKPLERGRVLKVNGKQTWVTFRYEKLPHFCFHCGRILHDKMPCSGSQGVRQEGTGALKPWGVWLRAEDDRNPSGSYSLGEWRGGGKSEAKLSHFEGSAPSGGKGGGGLEQW